VAKAHADVVLISGDSGGTRSIALEFDQAPNSVEWLAETQQLCCWNDLRSRIECKPTAKLQTGRDVVLPPCGRGELASRRPPLVAMAAS